MSFWDHAANDLRQALADTDGPGYTAVITVPGAQPVSCRVMAEERPQAFLPGEGGNTMGDRQCAVTISRLDVIAILRQSEIVFDDGAFAGCWRVQYVESRTDSAWVVIATLQKIIGAHGAGVRS